MPVRTLLVYRGESTDSPHPSSLASQVPFERLLGRAAPGCFAESGTGGGLDALTGRPKHTGVNGLDNSSHTFTPYNYVYTYMYI